MATLTQRISQFRGINRSLRQNGLDVSYAYNAENVDIVGGMLTNKNVGSDKIVHESAIQAGRPLKFFVDSTKKFIIIRDKYFDAYDRSWVITDVPWYAPDDRNALHDISVPTGKYIRGAGLQYARADMSIEDIAQVGEFSVACSESVMIVPGMLSTSSGDAAIDPNGHLTNTYGIGSTALFYVYNARYPEVGCRQFGSGRYLTCSKISATTNDNGKLTSLTTAADYSTITYAQRHRALIDGIYISHTGNSEEGLDESFMWLKVTDVTENSSGKAVFTVDTTRQASEIATGSGGDYLYVRGGCSDYSLSDVEMFYGRLFAVQAGTRRLHWSRLPGDGRTIEDWTSDDASLETSGGHVDVGDPSDGTITEIIACGSQLLIFTENRLWRLYGSSPSNYQLELVGDLESERISNPINIKGGIYWLSRSGLAYFNGSYISYVDDNYNLRYIMEDLPEGASNAHAVLFGNSVMFSFDISATVETAPSSALVVRYELETGNVTKYVIPNTGFLQQFTDTWDGDGHYYQALVDRSYNMYLTWMNRWGEQTHGWYNGDAVVSKWETDWDDYRSPETVKKAHTVIMRGQGEFLFSIESEVNKEKLRVSMPESRGKVMELSPHYAEGRSMKMAITSNKQFEIEPYMTIIFETGGKR